MHWEKLSRLIQCGDWMHIVMIAIEYGYKLGRKNIFNLWCKLGQLLLRLSHLVLLVI